jgi:DNA-binding CsgD family transcriptional regulator
MSEVIGREPELAVLERFTGQGAPGLALLLTGGPGIGKTALWERGLRLARDRGIRVLAARPSGAEAELSFAGLFDLLEGIDIGSVSGLPVPQRRALEAALLRAEPMDAAPERFAIAAGFLGVLRSLAASVPLLIAVDDLQWLDAASAEVLAFAARRAGGQRVRFLLSRRSGSVSAVEAALGPAMLHTAELGPLSLSATRRLLSQCLGLTAPPRTLRRLFDTAQGNPLLVLELGRALAGGRTWAIGAEPPVADLAGNPFGARVAKLPGPAHRALLVTALSGHLSLPQLMAVADHAAVEELVAAGLLIPDGERVRLSHPLVAVAARRHSRIGERQALHRALADVAGDETLRARHLALSTRAQDADVAGIVAAAATAAARRGAAHDAAELAEHALRLTPSSAADYAGRLLALAQCLLEVGELSRVTELLGSRIGGLPAGGVRARAHLLLGEAADLSEHEDHLERALANCGDDPGLRATALATKARLLALVRVERIGEAEALAVEARRLARYSGAKVARHALQSLTWARILRGHPVQDLTEHSSGVAGNSSLYESSIDRPAAVRLAFAGRIAEARALLHRLQALADERGETRFGAVLTLHLCELELRAGELRESSRLLDEWAESGAMEGMEPEHARCCALLASLRGQPDETERWAAEAVPQTATGDLWDRWDELEVLRAQGIAALFAHEPERAAVTLGEIWEHTLREGVADPGAFPVAGDLVEALVWLGRVAEADAVTGRLRDLAERRDHPWALATASRCAAMARLASGYDERAAARLADAAASYGELGLRFDRARSKLWLGRAARRARKRTAARRALETARAEFDALGSAGWAGQARAELDLLGARGAPAGGLTAAEQRVVELAASGLSNKQIARRLFVAVHTVEVHLAHAYAKLGVQSRAQLASRLASPAPPQATAAPAQATVPPPRPPAAQPQATD